MPYRVVSLIAIAILIFEPCLQVLGQTVAPGMPLAASVVNNMASSGASFRGKTIGKGTENPTVGPDSAGVMSGMTMIQQSGFSYQVHVLGEITQPGTYRVDASVRLAEVLDEAGGILSNGSERRITLRRQGEGVREVDFFSFKRFGDLDANPYLLDNDVIFVPLRGKVVQIVGAINRPETYELKNERSLLNLVNLAGRFTAGFSASSPIRIVRFRSGKKEIIEIENSESAMKDFELENADVVIVPHFLTEKNTFDYDLGKLPGESGLFYPSYEDRVFVLGAVFMPGPYPFSPHYRARHYITLAGGTSKVAKTRNIRVLTSAGKSSKMRNDTRINPGDTIIVPEKYMSPESVLSLVLGLTTSVLGITTTVLTLSR